MTADLAAQGWLVTEQWMSAFRAVPRHEFLRRFFALTDDRSRYEAVDDTHPDWLRMAYRNAVWPTQLDADPAAWQRARDAGPISGEPTCSATQPSLMAIMLEALNARPGHSVLEVGTGTGYNAALLAHALGSVQVTTVDIDAHLTAQAQENLTRTEYDPTVITGDGLAGYPDRGPYDRLIATCSVTTIPAAWREQVRPGGVIVTNLYRRLVGGSIVRLTVKDDHSAAGTLLDDSGGFMPLRAHQAADLWELVKAASKEDGHKRASALPEPVADDGPAWVTLADLLMPDVARTEIVRDEGSVQWLVHPDGSWAYHEIATGEVEQGGARNLWNDLENIHTTWVANGRPSRENIGITVTAEGEHRVWLGNEANIITA